jgi:hypothetical protein
MPCLNWFQLSRVLNPSSATLKVLPFTFLANISTKQQKQQNYERYVERCVSLTSELVTLRLHLLAEECFCLLMQEMLKSAGTLSNRFGGGGGRSFL